jgi:hypothetical protein
MVKRSFATLLSALLILPAILVSAPSAQANLLADADGNVDYRLFGVRRSVSFEAEKNGDDEPASGWLRYSDTSGHWFRMNIRAMEIDPSDERCASFAGQIQQSSPPWWAEGQYWMFFRVCDFGSRDQVWEGYLTTRQDAINKVRTHFIPPYGPATIERGNLEVDA